MREDVANFDQSNVVLPTKDRRMRIFATGQSLHLQVRRGSFKGTSVQSVFLL